MDQLTLLEHQPSTTPLSILPIPLDIGADNHDVVNGPAYLLGLGLQEKLQEAGLQASVLPPALSLGSARATVAKEIANKKQILALGGDHAVAIGTIAGASQALQGDLGVIWIDVHGDLHTHETSWSGNVHGMATTALMGFGSAPLTSNVRQPIKTENFLHLGLRHVEQAEIDFIRTHKLAHVTMMEIDARGLSPAHAAIDALAKRVSHLWVSLDVDAIDEDVAPASAMAGRGGFTYREIINLFTYINKRGRVVGLDMVEVTPHKDVDHKTGALCVELAAAAFGALANDYAVHMRGFLKGSVEKLIVQAPVHPSAQQSASS